MSNDDYISLKWGTLKAWKVSSEKSKGLLKEYGYLGQSLSAMAQADTPRQKEIICELIDDSGAEQIYLEWDDKFVSKDEAKAYVMGYGA